MDEIVSILGDMGDHGRRWMACQLNAEPVSEWRIDVGRVLMVRKQALGELRHFGRKAKRFSVARGKHVSVQIRRHVASSIVLYVSA